MTLTFSVKPSDMTGKYPTIYDPAFGTGDDLPDKIFLRDGLPARSFEHYENDPLRAAYDQYGLHDSASDVGCNALELAYARAGHPVELSRLYLFDKMAKAGSERSDPRKTPYNLCSALHRPGTCLKDDCNYGISDGWFGDIPRIGSPFKVEKYEFIHRDKYTIRNIKHALSQGIPVMAMIYIHESYLKSSRNWHSTAWDILSTNNNRALGYQMMLITGYDNHWNRFLAESNEAGRDKVGIHYDKINTFRNEYWILSEIGVDYVPVKNAAITDNFDRVVKHSKDGASAWARIGDKISKEYAVAAKKQREEVQAAVDKEVIKYAEPEPEDTTIYCTAVRAMNPNGIKKTNILNMFNKPAPKGLGLDVTCCFSTLSAVSESSLFKVRYNRIKGPILIYNGVPNDSVTVKFNDGTGQKYSLSLIFVEVGGEQLTIAGRTNIAQSGISNA